MSATGSPAFVVDLELIGGERWSRVSGEVRLRRAAKALARAYGLRVSRVRRPASEGPGGAAGDLKEQGLNR